jgi:hypothetical protein
MLGRRAARETAPGRNGVMPADLPTSSLGGISILPLPKTLPASESETDVFFAAPRPESPWRSPTNAAKTAFKSLFTKSYCAAT